MEEIVMDKIFDMLYGQAIAYLWNIIEFYCRFLLYPLFAYALYQIALHENMEHPKLSIIPIYNMRYIADLIGYINVFGIEIKGILLSILLILCAILRNPFISYIPVVGNYIDKIGLIFLFVYLLALHKLWNIYVPKSADSYLILATLFPILIPILVFLIRNKQQVSSQMQLDYDSDGTVDEIVTIHNAVEKTKSKKANDKTVLKQELRPAWKKGCPLIVNRQDIVSTNDTNLYLELTLQNLSDATIKAIYMDILCFDYLQAPLAEASDSNLLDLTILPNQSFSTNMNILLPDNNTRKCKLTIKNIVFENDVIWNNEDHGPLELLEAPLNIQFKPELIKFMSNKLKDQLISHNKYLYMPVAMDDYWFCGCGQFNTSDMSSCCFCHINKNKVFDIINEENLQRDYTQMMQEKAQHAKELKEQRQQMILEQKQNISNQISKGKDKLDDLLKKKQ